MKTFETAITAGPDDIDELSHVNNAVWVRWIQDVATLHWQAAADPAHVAAYLWVVVRHEIDYLRPLREGETVMARTTVGDAPRGARFDRHIDFVGADGKLRVRSNTTWAIVDRATRRALRVPAEVTARFA